MRSGLEAYEEVLVLPGFHNRYLVKKPYWSNQGNLLYRPLRQLPRRMSRRGNTLLGVTGEHDERSS